LRTVDLARIEAELGERVARSAAAGIS
jgi:hypothetical protein